MFIIKDLDEIQLGNINCYSCGTREIHDDIKSITTTDDMYQKRKDKRYIGGVELYLCKECRKRLRKILEK